MQQKPSANAKGNWRIHAVIVVWCVAAVSTEHWFPGWSGAICVAGVVPGLAIYAGWRLWGKVWYWLTIAISAALQVPLVIYAQPLIVRFKLPFLLPFAIVDFLGIGAILEVLSLIFGVDKIDLDSFESKK